MNNTTEVSTETKASAARYCGRKGGRPLNDWDETVARAKAAAADSFHKDSVRAYHATGESGNFALWNNAFDKARGIVHPAKSHYERRMGSHT